MALRLLADENFKLWLLRALLRELPGIDVVRAQEVGLVAVPDDQVLAWAARENRILLTHDIKTVPPLAEACVAAGLPMPGVFVVRWTAPAATVLENMRLLAGAGEPADWEQQVWYLPL